MRKGLLGAVAVVAIVIAQSLALNQFVLTETAQIAAVSRSRVAGASSLPVQINAAEYSATRARRNLVPAMLGSIAIGDIDGDGQPDIYVADPGGPNVLLRNAGGGGFQDITNAARVGSPQASLSATFGDYDHSGYQSLFVAGAEGITLYRNKGNSTFSNVTRKSGLQSTRGELHTSLALGDVDRDGFLDLLVGIYTDLNHPPARRVFTFPNDFSGAVSRLYRNNGNGTFSEVIETGGLAGNPGRVRKVIFADLNDDQRPDILLLRDEKPPALYLNRGDWKFEETTWNAGDALTRHAFFDGVATDLDGDGRFDLVLWSTLSFKVLLNQGNATFLPAKSLPQIPPLLTLFGFHGAVADLDGNGSEDVLMVDRDGHLLAFANSAGTFREVSLVLPPGFEGVYLAPLKLRGSRRAQLVAVNADGHIALLGIQTSR